MFVDATELGIILAFQSSSFQELISRLGQTTYHGLIHAIWFSERLSEARRQLCAD